MRRCGPASRARAKTDLNSDKTTPQAHRPTSRQGGPRLAGPEFYPFGSGQASLLARFRMTGTSLESGYPCGQQPMPEFAIKLLPIRYAWFIRAEHCRPQHKISIRLCSPKDDAANMTDGRILRRARDDHRVITKCVHRTTLAHLQNSMLNPNPRLSDKQDQRS